MGLVTLVSGYLKKRSEEREAARQRAAAEFARAEYERAEKAWADENVQLRGELAAALGPDKVWLHDDPVPIVLHKGEHVLLVLNGAALVEPRRLPGQWVGGYSGFSFRVMKGVTYHTGGSRGTYVPGPEAPSPIAVGTATITNQRVVFQSDKQAREFTFAKLLGYQHDPSLPLTFFQVSNRQKVSGIGYDTLTARIVRFRLSLGIAEFQGQLPALVQAINEEIIANDATRPAQAAALPALGRGHSEVSTRAV